MVKIAEEQAVYAEVLGATSSLADNGILHLASEDDLETFVKVASDIMMEVGYNTPEELATGIIEIYKEATDLAYDTEDMEPEDYEEDEEDAENDTIAQVIKQASDIDEAYNLCVDLTDNGYLSTATMDKVAAAYDSGELAEILYQTKLEKVAGIGDLTNKVKDKIRSGYTRTKEGTKAGYLRAKEATKSAVNRGVDKWNSLSKGKKIGIGAGLAGAGLAGIGGAVYYKKRKKYDE